MTWRTEAETRILGDDGIYDATAQTLDLSGNVRIKGANFALPLRKMKMDFKANVFSSDEPVRLELDNGWVEADGMTSSDNGEDDHLFGRREIAIHPAGATTAARARTQGSDAMKRLSSPRGGRGRCWRWSSPPRLAAPLPQDARRREGVAARAQRLLPGASSHEPINISADKLDYFDKQQKAVYSGNVVVDAGRHPPQGVGSDHFLRQQARRRARRRRGPALGASSGVRRMEGKGPIVITNKDQVGTGDSLALRQAARTNSISSAMSRCRRATMSRAATSWTTTLQPARRWSIERPGP